MICDLYFDYIVTFSKKRDGGYPLALHASNLLDQNHLELSALGCNIFMQLEALKGVDCFLLHNSNM